MRNLVVSWSLGRLIVQQTLKKKTPQIPGDDDQFIYFSKQNKTKQCVTSATVGIANHHSASVCAALAC